MSQATIVERLPDDAIGVADRRLPALEVAGLVKQYSGQAALAGLSLQVGAGSTVALVGPNGAGKTTLLKVITGLLAPTRGAVLVDQVEPADGSRGLLADVGVLTHETWLYDRLTVRENLALHARLRGLSAARVDEALEEAGLQAAAGHPSGICSHGVRKRLALARALLHDPGLLVLDEPFSGLDPAAQDRLGQLLDRSRGARTVLFSTHDPARAQTHADRIVALDDGRVVADQPVASDAGAVRGLSPARVAVPVVPSGGALAFLRSLWIVLAKDVTIELRSRAVLSALVVFAGLLGLALMMVFEPFTPDPRAIGGVLWVLIIFAGLHGLSRGFDEDLRDGALRGLLTTGCDPAAIYLAKVVSTTILLLVVGLVGAGLLAVAFDAPHLLAHLPGLLVVVALAATGLGAVGGVLTVIARQARLGETLLPIFLLPLAVPVLLAGIELIPLLLEAGTLDGAWIRILVLYDLGMLIAGAMLFQVTLEG